MPQQQDPQALDTVERVDAAEPPEAPETGSSSPTGATAALPAPVPRPPSAHGLPRLFLIALGGAGLAYCVMFVQGLGSVIAPVFLALNLIVTAYPLQRVLNRLGVPRVIGAAVTGILVLAVLGTFFFAIGWAIAQLVTTLPDYNEQFTKLVASVTKAATDAGIDTRDLSSKLSQLSLSSIVGVATSVFTNLSSAATLLTILVAVVFFMTMDSVSIDKRLELAGRDHPGLVGAFMAFSQGVRRYWIVSSVFGLISAALDVVALQWLGVPLAMVWGLLAFLCNYIPNIGFFIGLVPPALLALLALGPGHALTVVAVYVGLNIVVQSMIMPRFTGQAVGITATLTFVSLLFWSWVLGVLGALLAIPATLLVKAVLIDADPDARWANALIASDPLTYRVDEPFDLTAARDRAVQALRGRKRAAASGAEGSTTPTVVSPGRQAAAEAVAVEATPGTQRQAD